MTNGKNDNSTEITLKGSVDIVSDFFFTAINSILYQRGTILRMCGNECEGKRGLILRPSEKPWGINHFDVCFFRTLVEVDKILVCDEISSFSRLPPLFDSALIHFFFCTYIF